MANPSTTAWARFLTAALALTMASMHSGPAIAAPPAGQPLPTPEQLAALGQTNRAAFAHYELWVDATVRTAAHWTWGFTGSSGATHRLYWRVSAQRVWVSDQETNPNGDSWQTQTYATPDCQSTIYTTEP